MLHKSLLAACEKRGYVVESMDDRPLSVSDDFCAGTAYRDQFIRWRVGKDGKVAWIYCSSVIEEAEQNPNEEAGPGYMARSVQAAVAHLESFSYGRPVCTGIQLQFDCKCQARGHALIYSVKVEVVRAIREETYHWFFDFTEGDKVDFLRGQPHNGVLFDFLEENWSKFGELRAEVIG